MNKQELTKNSGLSRRNFLKQSSLFSMAAITNLMLPWKSFAVMANTFPVVDTVYGKIRGMDTAGIMTFRGIRYGESTAGANRFMPPVKPKKWNGVFEAFAYGPASPQTPIDPTDPYGQSVMWDNHVKSGISEDCLMLNVWTPGLNDGGNRPVFFYIHGGGFNNGSGSYPFDGDPLSRMGDVVVVTVNHRLGPFGYMDLGGISGSSKFENAGVVGMMDLVAALEWVNENISVFGGNPNNVTIMGQSGGGSKVSTLMVMPSAKGLFHKAVVESGSTLALGSRERNTEQAKQLVEELKINPAKIEDIQKIPWSDILEAEANRGFSPIVDGTVIPTNPFDPVAPEVSADVPMIVGYNREDASYRNATDTPLTEVSLKEWAQNSYRDNATEILATYRKVYPNATPFQIQARISTDSRLRKNATTQVERKSELNKGKAFLYLMEWASPAFEGRFESCHGVELGLILGNPRIPIAGNTVEARKLADIIGSSIIEFGRTGDPNCDKVPNWPAYNKDNRSTMIFNTECRVENDPTKELRLLWDSI
ncbi:MAG: carboxylesterase/lipase family protein [Prolixibacteraceae bacterium]|nr:carboxylesterase/lipase family protein [Prolixibacteraceae bacterium]